MLSPLTFAHITDVHLAEHGDSWGTLGSLSEHLLAKAIDRFNAQDDVAFVLITGDVLDRATPGELELFNALIGKLRKPWHYVPGNHDGYHDPDSPETLAPQEAVARIDPRLADPAPGPQRAFYSRAVADGLRLIGLDSRLPGTWNGLIGAEQLAWLRAELDACRDDQVIVATHHPLHNLSARNKQPWWSNFICDNGPEVEALLDAHPNVRLVLSGHHHASQLRERRSRLHVSTSALSGYPCAYRTIRLTPGDGPGAVHVQVETVSLADEGTRKQAYDLLVESETAHLYDPADPSAWANFVAGRPQDQGFTGWLDGAGRGKT
jgi:3',5'-cyclic-AMP phosphodiesterase